MLKNQLIVTLTGARMFRNCALIFVGVVIACARGVTAEAADAPSFVSDLRALLSAARGAPHAVCSLASEAIAQRGWNDGSRGAPRMPLARVALFERNVEEDAPRRALPDADVALLLENLSVPDLCVRELSVRVLARDRGEGAARGLAIRLTDTVTSVREVAALGLGLLNTQRAVTAPLLGALRDQSAGVRANVAWALGRQGDGAALRGLMRALDDESAMVRESAAFAVGRMDSSSAVSVLQRVLRSDPVAAVRRTAAWALGNLEASAAAQDLAAALLRDSDADVRENCAWALGNIDEHEAIDALMTSVRRDASAKVREQAAWALGEYGNATAAPALAEALGNDASRGVRETAAWALGSLEIKKAPSSLILALGDADDGVRMKASWALSEIEDPAAVPALKVAFKRERHAGARRAQLRALLASGGRSESMLTELIESGDAEVREAAVRGLAGRRGPDPWPWPQPRPRPFP
jgi:HEAT repeat protein